jgi:hypothetical protein
VMTLIADVVIFLLPLRLIWRLHVPIRQKVRVVFVFGVGAIVCITTLIRLIHLSLLIEQPSHYHCTFSCLYAIVDNEKPFFINQPAFPVFSTTLTTVD